MKKKVKFLIKKKLPIIEITVEIKPMCIQNITNKQNCIKMFISLVLFYHYLLLKVYHVYVIDYLFI